MNRFWRYVVCYLILIATVVIGQFAFNHWHTGVVYFTGGLVIGQLQRWRMPTPPESGTP